MTDHLETEWQFESREPPQRWFRLATLPSGFTLGDARTHDIADAYYDTDDWRLYRARYALRLRRIGQRREATLKQIAGAHEGRADRRELTATLPGSGHATTADVTAPDLVDRLGGVLADRIHAVAGMHPVRPVVELRTRRRIMPIMRDGGIVGELALDATRLPIEGTTAPARLHRIEVEVAPGIAPDVLDPLIASLRQTALLVPADRSKFEEALRVRGLVPSPLAELGPSMVDDTMTTGAVALANLRRSFAAFLEHEPGTRLGEDPEALHQMRVATRRLRATLALFRDVLPARVASHRATLAWLADVLGAVRDLDVQLDRLENWRHKMDAHDAEAITSLAMVLRRRRVAGRRRLLHALDCPRYERFVTRFAAFLRGPAPRRGPGRIPIVVTAPPLLRNRMRKVRKAGDALEDSSPAAAYHQLRIRCKQLRYALDAHIDVYGAPARRLVKSVARLQRLLGRHQDAQVAVAHLRELSERRGVGLSRRAIFVIGKIAERYEREAQRLRRRFPKRYRAATGRAWKRLRRAMEKRAGGHDVGVERSDATGPQRVVARAATAPARTPKRVARVRAPIAASHRRTRRTVA